MAEIQNFLQITGNGLEIKEFSEIRAALIQRYKEVYGSDIDLSTASADGIFVNDIALLINNILQTMGLMYANLDVDYATGEYLDTLCALSNITRKQATQSNTSLLVTNIGGSDLTDLVDLQFVDEAGNVWTHSGTESFQVGETKELYVVCNDVGPIEAPAGWITQTFLNTTLAVIQPNSANVGESIESDMSLRSRRLQSNGANGVTVLESLGGALLNISGIRDVYIYNNNSDLTVTMEDSTDVDPHSIYVVIRKDSGVEIDDSTIGNIIHEKLTPGIHTCESLSTSTYGTPMHYEYIVSAYGIQIVESTQDVYWKDAKGIAPQITISITPIKYFTPSEFESISSSLMEYLNELSISTALDDTDILVQTINSDPHFKGNPTYTVGTITIDSSISNENTFYNYTHYHYTITGGTVGVNSISDGQVTINGVTYDIVNNTLVYGASVYPIVNGKVTINDVSYAVAASIYALILS